MSLLQQEYEFKRANTLLMANQTLDQAMHAFNISTYAFTYYAYHPLSINKLKYDYASKNLKAWHQHYIEEKYETVDQTFESVYDTTLPIFWDVQTQLKNAQSDRERQMRADTLKFGVTKGFSIPIHGPREDFAILLASQRVNETWLDDHPEWKYDLMLLGHLYYAAIRRLILKEQKTTDNNPYELHVRELQCLTLVAQKNSVTEMAKKLCITERTVQFHIQNINKKLGTHSKYESVSKALEKGLITV